MRKLVLTLGALALLPATLTAQTESVEYNGATLARQIDVGGHQLMLNGYALRKKFIIKVYVAGLYLATKDSIPDQVLAADEARRMHFFFIYGVHKNQLCDAWNEGLEKNVPDASAELKARFETLCGYMTDMKKTDLMFLTYVPGQGTTVEIRGEVKGTIPGKDFADAVLATWIGPKPGPGDGFKQDVLGRKN